MNNTSSKLTVADMMFSKRKLPRQVDESLLPKVKLHSLTKRDTYPDQEDGSDGSKRPSYRVAIPLKLSKRNKGNKENQANEEEKKQVSFEGNDSSSEVERSPFFDFIVNGAANLSSQESKITEFKAQAAQGSSESKASEVAAAQRELLREVVESTRAFRESRRPPLAESVYHSAHENSLEESKDEVNGTFGEPSIDKSTNSVKRDEPDRSKLSLDQSVSLQSVEARPSPNVSEEEFNQGYADQLERRVSDLNMTVNLLTKERDEAKKQQQEMAKNQELQDELRKKDERIARLI